MDKLADIGVLGIGVMGRSLALNFADNGGYSVAVYDREQEKVAELLAAEDAEMFNLRGADNIEKFVASLVCPRKILLVLPAGNIVDTVLDQLLPLLRPGDVIMDFGNSFFQDTIRREQELKKQAIHFFGVGISGGEEGARYGACIMPGGEADAYGLIKEHLEAAAAKYEGQPCCSYIGANGAGHYVKMVHNGIEYADMQLISEAYYILRNYLGLGYDEMADIFAEWNKRELGSFLLEITVDILRKVDLRTGKPMLEVILDRAGQKGTGMWTAQAALDLGVAAPTIAASVFARCGSADPEQREQASAVFQLKREEFDGDKFEMIEAVYDGLLASKIAVYDQGFRILSAAAEKYSWELDYVNISSIWRNGCIIRARLLKVIADAYRGANKPEYLLSAPAFSDILRKSEKSWRLVVADAFKAGIPLPGFSSALAYYLTFCTRRLWTNMIQAQRDYFGAHTFERVDEPQNDFFHIKWN